MRISKKEKLCWVVLGEHNKSLPQQLSLRRIPLKKYSSQIVLKISPNTFYSEI